jgi:adenylate cyclase
MMLAAWSDRDGDTGGGGGSGRRAVAITFADVVGYSTLMAADERGTYTRWMALLRGLIEPELARHGGRIVDMAGDGVLAEFQGVDAAVAWAQAVQRGVRLDLEGPAAADPVPIALRIGVHFGEVFEAGTRLFGDAVNFAARLQSHAAPGGIVISERAREALGEVAHGLPLRELGYADLKGFERRARIFAIETDRVRVVAPVQAQGGLPSIAVLPLYSQEKDPEEAYFADGFAEDVAMSLAGLHELFVVSSASSAMFRGRLADPRDVGRALGVRYALLGRMRGLEGGFGVSVQLCDTRTGEELWGERMRVTAGEVFEMQDDIVRKVVSGLAPHVRAAELQRAMRKPPESQTAYERMLRALYALSSADRDTFDRARGLLDEAMAEEPGFALPVAWAARWHSVRIGRGWSPDPEQDAAQGFALGTRAVGIDRANALALSTLGHIHTILRRDSDAALECFREALAACPNHALAWTLSSATLAYLGDGAEAVRRAEQGLRLSPQDPMRYSQFMFLGIAHYASGNFGEAVRWQRRSAAENPLHGATLLLLAAALAADGSREEARLVGARFVALRPGFSLDVYARTRLPFFDPALRAAFAAHLREAGLPD